MRNDLPETCFATLPGQGSLIIIKRGETGYYRSDWDTGDRAKNQEIADFHNSRRGITPVQVEAMQAGSMFGFDVPGANPQFYYNMAQCDRITTLDDFAAIKDPVTSQCSSIEGKLYSYQVAGKKSLYLDVSSIPQAMMGKSSDLIILPDLVEGKPLVPVAVLRSDEASGTLTLGLENGSFSQGKEKNEDYQIIAKVRVGPLEYSLGEMDHKIPFFVTWERTPANDGDGPPNYYWGNYFDSREKAIQDFCDRAEKKFKMLSHDRKPSIKAQLAAKPVPGDKPASKAKDREAR